MTTRPLHHGSGLHYAQIIPSAWGPHADLHAIFSRFAERCPWMSVHDPLLIPPDLWQSDRVLVIAWARMPAPPPSRRARVAVVYSEAIGERDEMLAPHVAELEAACQAARERQWDALFCHTPWMVDQMTAMTGLPAHLLPIGWDEPVMGCPRFAAHKEHDYIWYGSSVGKRALMMPFMHQHLDRHLLDVSGAFGRLLLGYLERARASLYIAHSDVQSFSTWRIWQTLATSAALVMEPGDCWPLDPARHAVEIPRVTWANADAVATELHRMLLDVDLLAVARRAHEEVARQYTTERCINEYMVPAGQKIAEATPERVS